MLHPNERDWKEFSLKEIFITEIKNDRQVPTGAYVPKKYLEEGPTPRITATSCNNGIDGFYSSAHKNYRVYTNFISVSFLGTVFYHPYMASLDMKVHCLKLIEIELDWEISTFLIAALKKSFVDASYGNQLSSSDLPHKKIMLPVDAHGRPDYNFMKAYIEGKKGNKMIKYRKLAINYISRLGEKKDIPTLNEKRWSEFSINKIFSVSPGKRLESYNMSEGERPFIGAVDSSNGITNYVSNDNDSKDKNVLGVNYNGNGMVISFYHPYECIFSDDVKRFHLREIEDNKHVFLFMKTAILKQKSKYNYGYKFNGARMARQKIMLPINDKGDPDYQYMEQYMKNVMIDMYIKYLEQY